MDKLVVKCPAKINLSLDVIGEREDGYHLLRMIMQSVELFDEITIHKNNEGINVHCSREDIPSGEDNICYKTARMMFDKFEINGGIDIFIQKNIPVSAGLAGGSTDAAGVIYAVNELYELKLSLEDMMRIGIKVGADVPYCLLARTSLSEGIGEVLTPLKPFEAWCVIAKPNISVSTKDVYSKIKTDDILKHPDTEKLIQYIEKRDVKSLSESMVNVLETVTIKEYPIIFEIKNIMNEFNTLGSLMSGSGPSVFGIFEDRKIAEKCYNRFRDYLKEVYIVKTYNDGIKFS